METKLSIKGQVVITLKRKGKIVKKQKIDNLITNNGLILIAKGLIESAGYVWTPGSMYIGVGSDEGIPFTPAPSPTDLTLANELPDVNIPRKIIIPAGFRCENNVAILEVEFMLDEGNPNIGFELTEAGLFWDGATANRNTGVLMSRVLMVPPLEKNPTYDALGIEWKYTFNRE